MDARLVQVEASVNQLKVSVAALADEESKILAAIESIDSIVTTVSDADLARIADAVADE